jgi:Trypsin
VKGETLEHAVALKYVRLGEFDITNDTDCIQELNGQLDCTDPPVDYTIEKIIPHPLYNPNNPSKHHDLAILKLNDVVKYSDFVQPICLPTKEFDKGLMPGKPHMVTGWGKTDLCESLDNLPSINVNQ